LALILLGETGDAASNPNFAAIPIRLDIGKTRKEKRAREERANIVEMSTTVDVNTAVVPYE